MIAKEITGGWSGRRSSHSIGLLVRAWHQRKRIPANRLGRRSIKEVVGDQFLEAFGIALLDVSKIRLRVVDSLEYSECGILVWWLCCRGRRCDGHGSRCFWFG